MNTRSSTRTSFPRILSLKHNTMTIITILLLAQVKPEIMQAIKFDQFITSEPSRGKTNNVVSEQVPHKSGCTGTKAG